MDTLLEYGGPSSRSGFNPADLAGTGLHGPVSTHALHNISNEGKDAAKHKQWFHDEERSRCVLCNESITSWAGHVVFVPHQARIGIVERVMSGLCGPPEQVISRWWGNLNRNEDGFATHHRIPGLSSNNSEERRQRLVYLLEFLQANGILKSALGVYNRQSNVLGRTWEFERFEMIGDNVIKYAFYDRLQLLFPAHEGGITGRLNFVQQLVDSNEGLLRAFDYLEFDKVIGSKLSQSKFKSDVVEALFGELQVFLWAANSEWSTCESYENVTIGGPESDYVRALVEHVMFELTDVMLMFAVESAVRNAAVVIKKNYREPLKRAAHVTTARPRYHFKPYLSDALEHRVGAVRLTALHTRILQIQPRFPFFVPIDVVENVGAKTTVESTPTSTASYAQQRSHALGVTEQYVHGSMNHRESFMSHTDPCALPELNADEEGIFDDARTVRRTKRRDLRLKEETAGMVKALTRTGKASAVPKTIHPALSAKSATRKQVDSFPNVTHRVGCASSDFSDLRPFLLATRLVPPRLVDDLDELTEQINPIYEQQRREQRIRGFRTGEEENTRNPSFEAALNGIQYLTHNRIADDGFEFTSRNIRPCLGSAPRNVSEAFEGAANRSPLNISDAPVSLDISESTVLSLVREEQLLLLEELALSVLPEVQLM